MHEGHHGIFDDIEDMDDLFGISEDHNHEHNHHNHIDTGGYGEEHHH